MPRNKDLKRLVRGRMVKTGESYTAARAVLVRRRRTTSAPSPAPDETPIGSSSDALAKRAKAVERPASPSDAAPRKAWPKLAGMSDAVLVEKTGRTWAAWVDALDAVEAHRLSHRDIARLVSSRFGVGSWWTQMVTVGYERIRGLRAVGQRSDGTYNATKSRTFPADLSTVFAMFKDARRRKTWLPDGPAKLRTAIENKTMRFDWNDGTRVMLYFTKKGSEKTVVSVEHAKLTDKADAERRKAFWAARFDALAGVLKASSRA